jgi:hypothetical protein
LHIACLKGNREIVTKILTREGVKAGIRNVVCVLFVMFLLGFEGWFWGFRCPIEMGADEEINALVRAYIAKEMAPSPVIAQLGPIHARPAGDPTSKTCELL